LAAVPFDISFDVLQISSAANLPLSQSRQALQTLRERGLVETASRPEDQARFRRSVTATAKR
jgi:DNA-binding IclR family transcriptional regulator